MLSIERPRRVNRIKWGWHVFLPIRFLSIGILGSLWAAFPLTSAFQGKAVLHPVFFSSQADAAPVLRLSEVAEQADTDSRDSSPDTRPSAPPSPSDSVSTSDSSESGQGEKAVADTDFSVGTWPRSYTTPQGGTITLHQPQITSWENFSSLTALVAAVYQSKDTAQEPAFGVITFRANTLTEQENDLVVLSEIEVQNINFSTLGREELSEVALKIGGLLPTRSLALSMRQVTQSLENYTRLEDTKNLNTQPPRIFVSQTPAVLLQTNGSPILAPVEGVPGLEFVVNTNWDLLFITKENSYYLRINKSWARASDLKGPWTQVTELPALFLQLPNDANWKEARAAIPPTPEAQGMPSVFYTDTPGELIVITGTPVLAPISGTSLQWVSNTESDLFFDLKDKNWYFLTSGRWFRATALDSEWAFASDTLPDDFLRLPEEVPYGSARSSVPGTSESEEARLKASIPVMAKVDRKNASVDVTYDGAPVFQDISGTALKYALNTNETVLLVGNRYYVCSDGVWFVGESPTGPFVVAVQVPEVIYTIPPTSPVYNVTYVRVYDSSPDFVWYGYTSGYLWGFSAWGSLVYGTGWYYPPYFYAPRGRPPIYRPWPLTYGMKARYNPVYGRYGRYGYAYGPYRGVAAGSIYNPATGRYIRAGSAWGPAGRAGFVSVWGPHGSKRFVSTHKNDNVYRFWDKKYVTTGRALALPENRPPKERKYRKEQQDFYSQRQREQRMWKEVPPARRGDDFPGGRRDQDNLYATKSGEVYRKRGEQWERFTKEGWRKAAPPPDQRPRRGRESGAPSPQEQDQPSWKGRSTSEEPSEKFLPRRKGSEVFPKQPEKEPPRTPPPRGIGTKKESQEPRERRQWTPERTIAPERRFQRGEEQRDRGREWRQRTAPPQKEFRRGAPPRGDPSWKSIQQRKNALSPSQQKRLQTPRRERLFERPPQRRIEKSPQSKQRVSPPNFRQKPPSQREQRRFLSPSQRDLKNLKLQRAPTEHRFRREIRRQDPPRRQNFQRASPPRRQAIEPRQRFGR